MARRAETPHRHTVPNSSYASFPCYQEELKLKTNVRKCDTSDEAQDNAHQESIQVNVNMHEKLKMCFAEMETMKDQFDNRRKKLATKKRMPKERADASERIHLKPSFVQADGRPIKVTNPQQPFDVVSGKVQTICLKHNMRHKFTLSSL